MYVATYPRDGEKQVISGLGQVWRFARDIQIGDVVTLPLKTESAFAFGRVVGEYQYKTLAPNVMHVRSVEWLATVPRSVFPKDILYSMNAAQTVFRVYRNDAEGRVGKILGSIKAGDILPVVDPGVGPDHAPAEDELDLEETARDEILKFIESKFKGHDLARLVGAVLRAEGYKTVVSPAGPDGGVDPRPAANWIRVRDLIG